MKKIMILRSFSLLLLLGLCSLILSSHAAENHPTRIISVGGQVTELIYAMGGESMLVGVDTSSIYPPEAEALPKVGYQRQLSVEGVLSLRPDVVIGTSAMGPPAAVDRLSRMGLNLVFIPDVNDVPSAVERIHYLGKLLGLETQAERIATDYQMQMQSVLRPDDPQVRHSRLAMFFSHGGGNAMALGGDTLGGAIINMLGAQNVFADIKGTKAVSAEALLAADPDVVILSQQAVDASGGLEGAISAIPGLDRTRAAQKGQVVVVDLLQLLGFGPRQPEAIQAIMAVIDAQSGTPLDTALR